MLSRPHPNAGSKPSGPRSSAPAVSAPHTCAVVSPGCAARRNAAAPGGERPVRALHLAGVRRVVHHVPPRDHRPGQVGVGRLQARVQNGDDDVDGPAVELPGIQRPDVGARHAAGEAVGPRVEQGPLVMEAGVVGRGRPAQAVHLGQIEQARAGAPGLGQLGRETGRVRARLHGDQVIAVEPCPRGGDGVTRGRVQGGPHPSGNPPAAQHLVHARIPGRDAGVEPGPGGDPDNHPVAGVFRRGRSPRRAGRLPQNADGGGQNHPHSCGRHTRQPAFTLPCVHWMSRSTRQRKERANSPDKLGRPCFTRGRPAKRGKSRKSGLARWLTLRRKQAHSRVNGPGHRVTATGVGAPAPLPPPRLDEPAPAEPIL